MQYNKLMEGFTNFIGKRMAKDKMFSLKVQMRKKLLEDIAVRKLQIAWQYYRQRMILGAKNDPLSPQNNSSGARKKVSKKNSATDKLARQKQAYIVELMEKKKTVAENNRAKALARMEVIYGRRSKKRAVRLWRVRFIMEQIKDAWRFPKCMMKGRIRVIRRLDFFKEILQFVLPQDQLRLQLVNRQFYQIMPLHFNARTFLIQDVRDSVTEMLRNYPKNDIGVA